MASATLKLHRRWGGIIDRTRSWNIELDGTTVGTIAVDGTVELPVEPGHHTLRLHGGRHVSPERAFDAGDGDMVSFRCRAATLWPQYIAALVKPELWISLRRE